MAKPLQAHLSWSHRFLGFGDGGEGCGHCGATGPWREEESLSRESWVGWPLSAPTLVVTLTGTNPKNPLRGVSHKVQRGRPTCPRAHRKSWAFRHQCNPPMPPGSRLTPSNGCRGERVGRGESRPWLSHSPSPRPRGSACATCRTRGREVIPLRATCLRGAVGVKGLPWAASQGPGGCRLGSSPSELWQG